jgi:hypothetical protein
MEENYISSSLVQSNNHLTQSNIINSSNECIIKKLISIIKLKSNDNIKQLEDLWETLNKNSSVKIESLDNGGGRHQSQVKQLTNSKSNITKLNPATTTQSNSLVVKSPIYQSNDSSNDSVASNGTCSVNL